MEYGCESWRIYNSVLTQMIQQAQKVLQELRYLHIRENMTKMQYLYIFIQ